jgi:hypothetical protein
VDVRWRAVSARSETNRKARLAERRRQEQARERRRRIAIAAGLAVVVAGAAGGIALAATSGGSSDKPIAGVVNYPNLKNDHVTGKVDYPQSPPVGGPHNAVWLNCGIYPSAVPNENAVHALEHGAIWITYKPGLADAQLAKLKELAGSSYMVLSPYADMASPITVSAWGEQMTVTTADDPRIPQFIAAYKLSKDAPEPGAACSGGIGTPE